jgi:hypothetical protein
MNTLKVNSKMKNNPTYWLPSGNKSGLTSPSIKEKSAISDFFQPLIENFKQNHIKKNPDKRFNYLNAHCANKTNFHCSTQPCSKPLKPNGLFTANLPWLMPIM